MSCPDAVPLSWIFLCRECSKDVLNPGIVRTCFASKPKPVTGVSNKKWWRIFSSKSICGFHTLSPCKLVSEVDVKNLRFQDVSLVACSSSPSFARLTSCFTGVHPFILHACVQMPSFVCAIYAKFYQADAMHCFRRAPFQLQLTDLSRVSEPISVALQICTAIPQGISVWSAFGQVFSRHRMLWQIWIVDWHFTSVRRNG